jgi:hypothetical protein
LGKNEKLNCRIFSRQNKKYESNNCEEKEGGAAKLKKTRVWGNNRECLWIYIALLLTNEP